MDSKKSHFLFANTTRIDSLVILNLNPTIFVTIAILDSKWIVKVAKIAAR
jgi:hypothetical protein